MTVPGVVDGGVVYGGYPGPTIVTEANCPVSISIANNIPDDHASVGLAGQRHLLKVDRSMMCETNSLDGTPVSADPDTVARVFK